jgi:hypothetical protein
MKPEALQPFVKGMKYKVAFRVFLEGYVPKSLNVDLRRHWHDRARLKQKLFGMLATTGIADIGPAQANEKRGVVILQERARLLDHDNLVGSVKAMVDCLKPTITRRGKAVVGFGVIFDDDHKHCELKVFQVKAKRVEQGTNILILVGEEA